MAERDEFGAFMIGFIVGGLAGAVSALLLAPQSGEDTRTYIRDKAIELRDQAAETVDQAYEQAEAAAIEARTRFDDLAKMTRERATDLQRRGTVILEEQKAKLDDVVQTTTRRKAEPPKPTA